MAEYFIANIVSRTEPNRKSSLLEYLLANSAEIMSLQPGSDKFCSVAGTWEKRSIYHLGNCTALYTKNPVSEHLTLFGEKEHINTEVNKVKEVLPALQIHRFRRVNDGATPLVKTAEQVILTTQRMF